MTQKTKIQLYRLKHEAVDGTIYGPWETVKKGVAINGNHERTTATFVEPTPKLAEKTNKGKF